MKLFNFNRNKSEGATSPNKKQIFSTPFLKIGEGNLSAPYINRYYTLQNVVQFGSDNLYPQLLNQLYFQSPIHGSCVDFITNAVIGGGWDWSDEVETKQKIEQLTWTKKNRVNKLFKVICRDWVIHRRITLLIHQKEGKPYKVERVDPATIRHDYNNTRFVYSSDWSRGMLETKEWPRWTPGCQHECSVYLYQEDSPGQVTYAIPRYNSILNWAYLDGEQAYFHKSNLQNSIFPSLAIRRPKEFGSQDEIDEFKEGIKQKTGASNGGRVMVLTGNGFDDVPEIVPINSNTNDKAFEWTSKELKENIAIGHMINPSIMGVKTAGQLGNTTEIKDSYSIFEKNVVMPEREELELVFNDLVHIFGIKNEVSINEWAIIDGIIKQNEEE